MQTSSPTTVEDGCLAFASIANCPRNDRLICNQTSSSFLYTCLCPDDTQCHKYRGIAPAIPLSRDCPCPSAPVDIATFLPIVLGSLIAVTVFLGVVKFIVSKRRQPSSATPEGQNQQAMVIATSVSESGEPRSPRSPKPLHAKVFPSPVLGSPRRLISTDIENDDIETGSHIDSPRVIELIDEMSSTELATTLLESRLIDRTTSESIVQREVTVRQLVDMDDEQLQALGIHNRRERARLRVFLRTRTEATDDDLDPRQYVT